MTKLLHYKTKSLTLLEVNMKIDNLTALFWYAYFIAEVVVVCVPLVYFGALFTNFSHGLGFTLPEA